MIVAIVGSRKWPDLGRVAAYVERIAEKHPDAIIVSGGAIGVDRMAEEMAAALGLDWISYRPYEYENMEYRKEFSIETLAEGDAAQAIVVAKRRRISPPFFRTYAQACFHRNGWIVDDAEVVVAFHAGGSSGTADSIRKARELGRKVFVYEATATPNGLVYAWGNNEKRATLKGRTCRVIARGRMNSVLVEFENGQREITSRYAVRSAA